MKKKFISLVVLYSVLILLVFPGQGKKSAKDLPDKDRLWLEEEVIYIITPNEKRVFLMLESEKERNIFIEAFWRQRDPTPGSPENESKQEHYQRIAYANKFLGRDTTKPGWKTDRGKIYIILGAPLDIDRYEASDSHYPIEVWFYQGDVKYGLPPYFNVAFFKKRGMSEFVFYSPVQDGPQNLLRNYYGNPTDFEAAYEKLMAYDPILARVSISLIPGERPLMGHPSLASDIMMGNVINLPQKKVDVVYAEKLLKYKDIVEVEYTANYVGSDYLVSIIKDSSDIFFVHFSIDPKTLSVGSFEDKYYSYFELVYHITTIEGKTIFQNQKTYDLRFNNEQLKDIKLKSYSIQDMFPLVPGNYKLIVLLKNTVSKEFTSFETDIYIPQTTSPYMTPLLFSYKIEEDPASEIYLKPFRIGRYQLFCQPNKVFTLKEELTVFFQIYGLSQKLEEEGSIKYTFFRENEEFMTKTVKISENRDKTNFILKFPLQNFAPDYYTLKVALIDKNQNEILFEKDIFSTSFLKGIARPWVISKAMPVLHSIEYSFILGNQLLNKGYIKEARTVLESAYRKNPLSLKFAYGFSRSLFVLKEYKKVKEVLKPFLENSQENYEFLSLLGKSRQSLQDYEEAIQYYKQYLDHLGTDLSILNSIGDCYYLLGENEEALVAWEKSLEIDPNQEEIKERIKTLKEKKK